MNGRFPTQTVTLILTMQLAAMAEPAPRDPETVEGQSNLRSEQAHVVRTTAFSQRNESLIGRSTGRAEIQAPVLFGFVDLQVQLAVRFAIEGAAARLTRPGCRDVLSDFADGSGQRLSSKLKASGRSAAEAFAELRFLDDPRAPQCRTGRLAFTQIDSRLVRVCGRQFRDRDRRAGEIILIHEFLHSLGLQENPPTSEAITDRVGMRCGD